MATLPTPQAAIIVRALLRRGDAPVKSLPILVLVSMGLGFPYRSLTQISTEPYRRTQPGRAAPGDVEKMRALGLSLRDESSRGLEGQGMVQRRYWEERAVR